MLPAVRRFTLFSCLLTAVVLPWHSHAQVFPRGNGIALSGMTQTDLRVDVANWAEMPGDPVEFRLSTQNLLETALKAAGISRRAANRNYLICSIQALKEDQRVAYTATAELWARRSTDVHTLLWKKGGISTIDSDQFDAELVATECTRYFLDEWSKWNHS